MGTWNADLHINGAPMDGIEMGDGFMNAIGGSMPMKKYVKNDNEFLDGVQYDDVDTPKLDERSVTLPFYISGATREDFERNKAAFYAVLYRGSVDLSVPSRSADVYHLKYIDGAQYGQSRNGCFARFQAKFTEPNPADRIAR